MTRKSVCSSVSALIHDDDTGCASGPSVLDFGLECAGPATDQRHKAAFEFIEVGGFAAAGRSEWRFLGKPDTHRTQSVTLLEPELVKVRKAAADAGSCRPSGKRTSRTGGTRSSKKGNSNSSK